MVPYIPERYFYVKKDINEQKQGPFALGELKKMDYRGNLILENYRFENAIESKKYLEGLF